MTRKAGTGVVMVSLLCCISYVTYVTYVGDRETGHQGLRPAG
jgi:hypothetical protein